jgi:hypothetical protein
MAERTDEARLQELERKLDELSTAGRWFSNPAWWGVISAIIAILASLYSPVWQPLFSSPDVDVTVGRAVVLIDPYKGAAWLQIFVTVSNPTSTVAYLDGVDVQTTYGRSKAGIGPGLIEGHLCSTVGSEQGGIPPHDSIQYSAEYSAGHIADLKALRTTVVVRPAYGAIQSSKPVVGTVQTVLSSLAVGFHCPGGTYNSG